MSLMEVAVVKTALAGGTGRSAVLEQPNKPPLKTRARPRMILEFIRACRREVGQEETGFPLMAFIISTVLVWISQFRAKLADPNRNNYTLIYLD